MNRTEVKLSAWKKLIEVMPFSMENWPSFEKFRLYWSIYGGIKAVAKSDYLFAASLLTLFLIPLWATSSNGVFRWVDLSFQILPSMVSFSLAALAVLLALSDNVILKVTREGGKLNSYLMKVSATLIHFILLQFIALIASMFLIAYPYWYVSWISFLLFSYAIFSGVASAMAIFGLAKIVNHAGMLDD